MQRSTPKFLLVLPFHTKDQCYINYPIQKVQSKCTYNKAGTKKKIVSLFCWSALTKQIDWSSYEKETGWKLEQKIARTKRYKESQAFLAKNIFCIVLTLEKKGCAKMVCMSPVFPVFHSEVTVLKTAVRMMASILKY